MRTIFADAGYWIALLNRHDDLHDKALFLSKTIQPAYVVTSEMVLTEVLNDFSKRGSQPRSVAVSLIKQLRQHPNTTIVQQTSQQFDDAIQLYEQRLDKGWSHTDCVSFIIMKRLGIAEALAYDKHFVQAGFVALMRNCQQK